jgi:hypothetical protein
MYLAAILLISLLVTDTTLGTASEPLFKRDSGRLKTAASPGCSFLALPGGRFVAGVLSKPTTTAEPHVKEHQRALTTKFAPILWDLRPRR